MIRVSILMGVGLMFCGCDALRLAPSEAIRQNCVLQQRTAAALVLRGQQEKVSPVMQGLAQRAVMQSEAVLAYTGFPQTMPDERESEAIAAVALSEGAQRPDVWALTDSALELGLGLAGLIGGAYGVRVVRTIKQLRDKSQALKEIVSGNELLRQQHPEMKTFFKEAHQHQSVVTRAIVAEITP